jgi:hypothetical protein
MSQNLNNLDFREMFFPTSNCRRVVAWGADGSPMGSAIKKLAEEKHSYMGSRRRLMNS